MSEPTDPAPKSNGNFWSRRSRRGKTLLIVGALVLAFAAVGALSDSAENDVGGAVTSQAETVSSAPDQEEPTNGEEAAKPSAECVAVPPDLVEALEEGFNTRGTSLRNAYAVKSNDLEDAWYISGDLEGPGLDGEDEIATWAKGGDLEVGGGLIIASDAVAREFSDWGAAAQPGSPAAEAASMDNHGARESQACVRDSFD